MLPSRILLAAALLGSPAAAEPVAAVCKPAVADARVVGSAPERRIAGDRAAPPLTDHANGFAWPDTPVGVARTASGYAFFASDGASHTGRAGNGKSGSATRTLGTLDHPLGTAPAANVVIGRNPDPALAQAYAGHSYVGGGPVYRIPPGLPGAGKLLMVIHYETPTPQTKPAASFYSALGLAASDDAGASWLDLGAIIRVNHPYQPDMDGFDIGDPPLVATPDHAYLQIYFRDWQGVAKHWEHSVTKISVARARLADVAAAAFGPGRRHAAAFSKYYAGAWGEPGIGGRSSDLNPQAGFGDELQVAYNADLGRYSMIVGAGALIGYAESADGLAWSQPVILRDFRGQNPNTYVAPVGTGPDPAILGRVFDVFYTWYPDTGAGWGGAELRRLTVTCR